jgi:hypothetical protein
VTERQDRQFVIGRLKAAGIPVMTMAAPRSRDGSIDIGQFMASKIDRHPNRRYNQMLVAQMVPFLRNSGCLITERDARVASQGLTRGQ